MLFCKMHLTLALAILATLAWLCNGMPQSNTPLNILDVDLRPPEFHQFDYHPEGITLTPRNRTKRTTALAFNYSQAFSYQFLYHDVQRSGQKLECSRVTYRGDACTKDVGDGGISLSGGMFSMGGTTTYMLQNSFSITCLLWSYIKYRNVYLSYKQFKYFDVSVRAHCNHIFKCHPTANEFYVLLGNIQSGFDTWDRVENFQGSRQAYKCCSQSTPASDTCGESAATLAAAAYVYANIDVQFSKKCLQHAQQLSALSLTFEGTADSWVEGLQAVWKNDDYNDEIVWGLCWLYKATNTSSYLTLAKSMYKKCNFNTKIEMFSWDSKYVSISIMLYDFTKDSSYLTHVNAVLTWCMKTLPRLPSKQVNWGDWVMNSYTANAAFIAGICAKANYNIAVKSDCFSFAQEQTHVLLGSSGRSMMCGFGKNPPKQPQHCDSSCPKPPAKCSWDDFSKDQPNPQILYGAVVNGCGSDGTYTDKRTCDVNNQVHVCNNACVPGCIAVVADINDDQVCDCAGL